MISTVPHADLATTAMLEIARERAALVATFGWTDLDVVATVDPAARILRISGHVAVPRLNARLTASLAPCIPNDWRLELATAVRPTRGWRSIGDHVRSLWRTPWYGPRLAHPTLASELHPSDGPVAVMTSVGDWTLVQADDGTVGWLHGPLGPATCPPLRRQTTRPRETLALQRLTSALRHYLGTPYVLGGTSPRRIDCSGLVQRAVREACGVVIPRHSTDQQALARPPGRSIGEPGDLLFMRCPAGDELSQCHVGVVVRSSGPGRRAVIHASARRAQVVEEPLDAVLRRTLSVQHMQLEQVLALPG